MFKVDVITPVYNNARFIKKCLESAHQLEEVSKIYVVDDGSTDGTSDILSAISAELPKIVVLEHPQRANKGIASSRNLGISHSSSPWIAFLDSDDYYLPNRFEVTRKVIVQNPEVNGVYEPVVNKVLSIQGALRFDNSVRIDGSVIRISTEVQSAGVFEGMYYGTSGVVHLDGLTIQRKLALEIGMFDQELKFGEDSVFRLKAAFKGKLVGGSEQPVAVRSIHMTNTEPSMGLLDIFKRHVVMFSYLVRWDASLKVKRTCIHNLLYSYIRYKNGVGFMDRFLIVLRYILSNPRLILHYFI